jgi:PAS domain S-box-containing protein
VARDDGLHTILSAVQAGVVLIDEHGAMTSCNPSAERIFGLPSEQIRDRGTSDPRWETVREDGTPLPAAERPGMVALRTGRPVRNARLGVRRPDGAITWVRVDAEPLADRDGRVTSAVLTLTDVTAERQAGLALRESEARLRALLHDSADALFVHDESGQFRDVSLGACKLLRYDRADLVGRGVTDVDPTLDPETARRQREQVPVGRPLTHQGVARRSDGTTFPYEVHLSKVEAPGEPLFLAHLVDVTDRERRESAVTAAHRALHVLAGTGEAVLHATSEPELLAEVCRVAVEEGGFRMAWVGAPDPGNRGFLVPVAWHGHEEGYLQRVKVTAVVEDAWGAGPGGQALRSGRVTVVNDAANDPRTRPWRDDMLGRGYRAGAAIPLVAGETRLGILAVYAAEPDAFGPEVVEVLQRMADDLAFGVSVLRGRSIAARTSAELALASELMGVEMHRLDLGTGRVHYTEKAREERGLQGDGDGVPMEDVWSRMHPDDLAWAQEQFAVAISARPGSPDYRPPRPLRYLLPDGTVRSFDWRSRVLFDAKGTAESVITAVIEVTDRMREQERLRALTARVQEVREEEKGRIARDLHDELGQLLTALQLELRGAEASAEELGPAAGPLVDRLVAASTLGDATLREVQRIARDLRSEALEAVGLHAALRQELRAFGRRTGIEVSEALDPLEDLDRRVATALFRIGQEALTNVARHAGARRAEVRLSASGDRAILEIADDGLGITGAPPSRDALGLLGMRERAAEFGGDVTVAPRPTGGTVVTATLPRARRPSP